MAKPRIAIRRKRIAQGTSPRTITRKRAEEMIRSRRRYAGVYDTREKLIAAGLLKAAR